MNVDQTLFTKVIKTLEASGLLLLTDPKLPSLVTLVVGKPIKGSWWGHPKGNLIFNLGNQLEDHKDVLSVKFISGKSTFIHRRLWQLFLNAVTARDEWQMARLPKTAANLLKVIEAQGAARMDKLFGTGPKKKLTTIQKEATRALEDRLLVLASSQHTETGAHFKQLESWEHWMNRAHFVFKRQELNEARTELEAAVMKWGNQRAKGLLPW